MPYAKVLLLIVLFFFFSMYKSCTEFSYTFSSERSEARLMEYYEAKSRKGGRILGEKVKYQFIVNRERYVGSYLVESGQGAQELQKKTVEVEYLASDPRINRAIGESDMLWVYLFFFFLALMFLFGFQVYREAAADVKKSQGG